MKNRAFFAGIILSGMLLNSCDSDQITCVRASSNIITENRDNKDFKGVVFNQVGDLRLTQGTDYSVKITGPDNVVELTESIVENGLLVINSNDCFNGSYELLVEVTALEFEEVGMVGVGDVESVGKITGDIMELNFQGIGDIDMEIEADSLYTTFSGTGTMTCKGAVIKHQFIGSGQFALNGYGLTTDNTEINVSGTGDSYVHVNNTLKALIVGTGDVYYKGSPAVDQQITGIGEVIDDN